MATTAPRTFRSWLLAELLEQGVARRELARRLAAKHPAGVTPQTIETHRRAIYRYLDEVDPMMPNAQTRAAFAEVLGVDEDEIPTDDEEEPDLPSTLQALVREQAHLNRRIERALKELA